MTQIAIHEVAPRDGLQMEPEFVPTNAKVAWIDALSEVGYAKIEVTSFTSPKAIPTLADAGEVMSRIRRAPGTTYAVLVPNLRGAERAIEARADELNVVMSASETHNLANLRMTQAQSLAQIAEVATLARHANTAINVSLSCTFGCPMEGEVALPAVLQWIDEFAALGIERVTLCDTTGMAFPSQVKTLCDAARERQPRLQFTGHFHNTRSMGLANTLAAIDAGITRFDMSLGGIGGCPYAPGAGGNVATEDVVHMLDCMGYDTGIDAEKLHAVSRQLRQLLAHELDSKVALAGPRLKRHPAPKDLEEIRTRALARA